MGCDKCSPQLLLCASDAVLEAVLRSILAISWI